MSLTVTLTDGRVASLSPLGEKPEFVDRVAEVLFKQWMRFWKEERDVHDAETVANWLRTVAGADTLPYYAIVHVGEELIACAGCDETENDSDTRGPWLMDVMVLEEHRGCGAFKPLVHHIMDVQRTRGVEAMYLWTSPYLVPVYERLGWKYLEHEDRVTEEHGKIPQPTCIADLTQLVPLSS